MTPAYVVSLESALSAPVSARTLLHRSSGCTGVFEKPPLAHMHTNVQVARSGARWPRSTRRAPRGAAAVATWAGWCEPCELERLSHKGTFIKVLKVACGRPARRGRAAVRAVASSCVCARCRWSEMGEECIEVA